MSVFTKKENDDKGDKIIPALLECKNKEVDKANEREKWRNCRVTLKHTHSS